MSVQQVNAARFEELIRGDKPVLLDFYADWCGPCRMLAPVIEEISAERTDIKVCKINVDNDTELAAAYGVMRGLPFALKMRYPAFYRISLQTINKPREASEGSQALRL